MLDCASAVKFKCRVKTHKVLSIEVATKKKTEPVNQSGGPVGPVKPQTSSLTDSLASPSLKTLVQTFGKKKIYNNYTLGKSTHLESIYTSN